MSFKEGDLVRLTSDRYNGKRVSVWQIGEVYFPHNGSLHHYTVRSVDDGTVTVAYPWHLIAVPALEQLAMGAE